MTHAIMRRTQLRRLALGTASALILASCASGGGSGTGPSAGTPAPTAPPVTLAPPAPPPPPPEPTPPPALSAADFRTAEYNRSWGLEAVHAADAYARGLTGAGVTIGVVDFNFDLADSAIAYHGDSRTRQAAYAAMYAAQFGEAEDSSHGHAVAAVAAARKDGSGMHGLAFDAGVLAVDYFAGVNLRQVRSGGRTYNVSDPWTYLTSRGARIVNTSFGYDEEDIDTETSLSGVALAKPEIVHPHADAGTTQQTAALPERYTLAGDYLAVANGALLVASAGNDGDPDPSVSNLDLLSELRARNLMNGPGAFIIAGASDSSGALASFSDRAGSARDHYLVAPGSRLVGPWSGGLSFISGTSFSAPMISGAAALVMQLWPSLTARQVADILFASATDLGAPGTDAIYGRGLLNVDAALQPIGATTLAVQSGSPTVASSGLVLGAAFGDAPAFRAALTSTMMLDTFGRDFLTDLSPHVAPASSALSLHSLLQQRFASHGAALGYGSTAMTVSLAHDSFARSYFHSINGLYTDEPRSSAVQFHGAGETASWTAGSGLSLRAALEPAATLSLTNAFSTPLESTGLFAAVTTTVAPNTALTFAASHANESTPTLVRGFTEDAQTTAIVTRLTTRADVSGEARSAKPDEGDTLSIALGLARESGSVLGSYSTGGLALNDSAVTVWSTLAADVPLTQRWTLKSAASFAITDVEGLRTSLIADIRPVLSTSFSVGLTGEGLLLSNDTLSFTLHQSLRAEHADIRLAHGDHLDAGGNVVFADTPSSLVPSGRELALESAYRVQLSGWTAEANLAYRMDAGHVSGRDDVAALFSLTRRY